MKRWLFIFGLVPWALQALWCGAGSVDVTPDVGAPSAGYRRREGPMVGVRDRLLATALVIETDERQVAWCGVDHLGLTSDMVAEIVEQCKGLVLVSSSHTHAGAGGFLPFGEWAEALAGPFDPGLRQQVIQGCVRVIEIAKENRQRAKIGVGIGELSSNRYRGVLAGEPGKQVTLVKIETEDKWPIAALFSWPCHPTCLDHTNREFSADFVGVARRDMAKIGATSIYVNGAQGDVLPDGSCEEVGSALADVVLQLWHDTSTSSDVTLKWFQLPYSFDVVPTHQGLQLPVDAWPTEINTLAIGSHLFLTIPGELTCVYEPELRAFALECGWKTLTICGLTNDVHGYILTPEAWEIDSTESAMSFGGRDYGSRFFDLAKRAISRARFLPLEPPRQGESDVLSATFEELPFK